MCHFKNWQNFFIQSFPLSIVVNEKPDVICLFFVEDEFFTSIYLSYYTLKSCINNKWCFIRLLILIPFSYFSVFRRHYYITKKIIFTHFLCNSRVFCSKGMKTIQTIKTTIIFDKISLKNADSFFFCKIMPLFSSFGLTFIFLYLESLKE